jgi:hypothetical protein
MDDIETLDSVIFCLQEVDLSLSLSLSLSIYLSIYLSQRADISTEQPNYRMTNWKLYRVVLFIYFLSFFFVKEGQSGEIPIFLNPFQICSSQVPKYASLQGLIFSLHNVRLKLCLIP